MNETVSQQIKNINELTTKITTDFAYDEADKSGCLDAISSGIKSLPQYFSAVIEHTIYSMRGETLRMIDPEKYRENAMALDKSRREKHIMLAQSINIINRIGKKYGIKVFDTGLDRDLYTTANPEKNISEADALNDRELAAGICYNFCKEVFLHGTNIERFIESHVTGEKDISTELYEMSNQIRNGENISFSQNNDDIFPNIDPYDVPQNEKEVDDLER